MPRMRRAKRFDEQSGNRQKHSPTQQRSKRPGWSVMPLEPRLMLAGDGDVAAAPAELAADSVATEAVEHGEMTSATMSSPDMLTQRVDARSIVFIDSSVEDLHVLSDSVASESEIVLVDRDGDGMRQITEHLSRRQNVAAVHIVAHGSQGALRIGSQKLTAENVADHADQLRSWRHAMHADADILLYGCETGKGHAGKQLVAAVAHLTGADVAASDDVTGNPLAGHDWQLERIVGSIEASIPFSSLALSAYQHHLALPNYASFNSTDDLQLNGDAVVTGGELRLVAAEAQQRGSTYFTTPIAVGQDTSFQTYFEARFDGGQGSAGGEGLAFVIQNSPAGVFAQNIGDYPGGLDYNALPNSIGVELDTFKNVYEQWADEITITVNGVMVTPEETTQSPFDLNDGQTKHVWVDYDGEDDLLSVFVSETNQQPQTAVLTANLQLDQIVGNQAYVGFAAATGTAFNNTYVESWTVNVGEPEPQPGNFTVAESASEVEDNGSITLDVSRVGGSAGAAIVTYTTVSGSASAGSDYGPVAGTLNFDDGETSKSVTINLVDDDEIEGTETFTFELTQSSGGTGLLNPRTEVNIIDDDAELPAFSSFDSSFGLQLNGDATVTDGELRLVSDSPQQRGSAYYTTALNVDSDTSFQTQFEARFDGGQGSAGGEGLAFVIQNSPAGVFAQNIGNYSGGLDYNAVPNSIGIELDTFKNVYEQWADEISITVDGVLVTPVETIQSPFDLNDGRTYNVWVDYDGLSDQLSVFLSDTAVKPGTALLTAELELDDIVGNQAYVGFAAATGTAFNNASIESWTLTADQPAPSPGNFVLGASAYSGIEGGDPVIVEVLRVGGTAGAATVSYNTIQGTADADNDYQPNSGTLNFADGENRKTVTLNLYDDTATEGPEAFEFVLTGSTVAGLIEPDEATITIIDDEVSLPVYPTFDSAAGLDLNGDATVTGGELRLVAAAAQQRGSAYYTTPMTVDADTSFEAHFAARFDGGQGSAGGEGLAFVIQNSPAGTGAQNIGNYSGGLDYNAVPNSVGIELDTFENVYEQWADEISITVNGVLVTPVATIQSPFDLNNGDTYDVWVEYDGEFDLLSVYISDDGFKPESPVLTASLELDQIVGDQAYLGFAAATGTAFNNAYIETWSVVETGLPDPNNPGDFIVASESVTVVEGETSAQVVIERIGGSFGQAIVDFATFDDTATAGEDYVLVSGETLFEDGETRKTITVDILPDEDVEGTESFSFRLVSSEGAGLLAPRTTNITIIDDDTQLPAFNSFDSAIGLQLNSDAVVTGGELRLTEALAQQRGSAYYTTPIDVTSTTSFQASFAARFDGGQGSAGGEGLAFVIQNSPAGVFAENIGDYPGGLNYNAVPNSIGIELDTFKNGYEQWADEITITVNGVLVTPVETTQSPYDLNNGDTYYVWVDYNGDSDVLAVYISDEPVKPAFALLRADGIELDQIVGDQTYVGFAAATGTAFNNSSIESWTMTLDVPQADPPVYPSGDIVENDIVTGLTQPLAVAWSPDGRNMYIAEKGGVIKVSRDGGPVQTLIDISDKTNEHQDRGLIDFAIHPDIENNPYIYLLYTVDPPEVYDNIGDAFAGPDGRGNRAGQLIRFTLEESSDYTTVDPNSEVIVLGSASTWDNFNGFTDSTLDFGEPPAGENPDGSYLQDFINSDSRSHTVGSLAWGINGELFVSIGDGASFNQTDIRALRVQDIGSLSGKILRIDPLTGQGLADNPFYNGDPDSNESKVYHIGLRNPWRIATDPNTGQLFIGDTGLANFEEINTGPAGSNFGWPFYEGGQGVNRRTPSYQNLPEAIDFYASSEVATPGWIALAHGPGSDVLALGMVANDSALGPLYDGDVFYNDFARGIVRHAEVNEDGSLGGVNVFTTGAQFVVDIQQGPDGYFYYVNIVMGTVGRWDVV